MKSKWFNWCISVCFRIFSKPLLKSSLDCLFSDTRMNLSSNHADEFQLCTYFTVISLLVTCPIASVPVYQHFCLINASNVNGTGNANWSGGGKNTSDWFFIWTIFFKVRINYLVAADKSSQNIRIKNRWNKWNGDTNGHINRLLSNFSLVCLCFSMKCLHYMIEMKGNIAKCIHLKRLTVYSASMRQSK